MFTNFLVDSTTSISFIPGRAIGLEKLNNGKYSFS